MCDSPVIRGPSDPLEFELLIIYELVREYILHSFTRRTIFA